jgi:hypothetical protein
MWFAALDDPRNVRWFPRFLERLLENEPAVTALLEKNPFADQRPQYIRAQFYDYTFAGGEEKSQGLWWRRRALGLYFPVVRLKVKVSRSSGPECASAQTSRTGLVYFCGLPGFAP